MRHRLAKHSHVIDKHFSMLPSPELRRRNIDRYHKYFHSGKIFHANKLQNGLAILSLQTCMLTALTAHWLFIARTVYNGYALHCGAQYNGYALYCAQLIGNPRWKKILSFVKFLQAMSKPGTVMGSHTI